MWTPIPIVNDLPRDQDRVCLLVGANFVSLTISLKSSSPFRRMVRPSLVPPPMRSAASSPHSRPDSARHPKGARPAECTRLLQRGFANARIQGRDGEASECRPAVDRTDVQLTTTQAYNVLIRQDPSGKYKVGAQGRRFFGLEGAEPLGEGAMVYKGYHQHVHIRPRDRR